jgi:hypothetical protein
MFTKYLVLLLTLTQLTACVAVPEINITETLHFDSPAPSQEPVSYADLMCCYDCTV